MLQLQITNSIQKDDTDLVREKDWIEQQKLKKEIEFMTNEQNTKELQLSDLRTKLAKRSDEL